MSHIFFKHIVILLLLLGMTACKPSGTYAPKHSDTFVSRDDLIDIANQWLEGKGPLAPKVRQTINGVETSIKHPELGMTDRTFFCDPQKGQISVWAHTGHDLYQVRLAVREHQINEIEVYDVYGVPRNMSALYGAYASRDKLIEIVGIYFDALVYPGLSVPFDNDVIRYEMGVPLCVGAPMCDAEHVFFSYLFRDVTDRRYVVDEEHGVIVAYISFELLGGIGGMTAVEGFKIEDGIINEIHAFWEFKFGSLDTGWDGDNIITSTTKRKVQNEQTPK